MKVVTLMTPRSLTLHNFYSIAFKGLNGLCTLQMTEKVWPCLHTTQPWQTYIPLSKAFFFLEGFLESFFWTTQTCRLPLTKLFSRLPTHSKHPTDEAFHELPNQSRHHSDQAVFWTTQTSICTSHLQTTQPWKTLYWPSPPQSNVDKLGWTFLGRLLLFSP